MWEVRERAHKGTMGPAITLFQQKAAPPNLALKPDNSVPPHKSLVPSKLLILCWNLDGFWWAGVSVLKLFRRMPGPIAARRLTGTESLLIFTTSHSGNSFSWHWCCRLGVWFGAETPRSSVGPSLLGYPSRFLPATGVWETSCCSSLPLFPVSTWLLLYIML